MHTQAVEDYLKAIYEIQHQQDRDRVATTVLAERLRVAPASATGMIKKLADMHLVIYEPYQGVVLTEAGRKIALEVIRHHRLIELFLAEALGMPWDEVHAEAHKIEHVLSRELAERIDAALGYPARDPHGAPIPAQDGSIQQPDYVRLSNLNPGQSGVVAQVSDHDPALLRYLGELGLYPMTEVEVCAITPFGGPLMVRIGQVEQSVSREAANHILMTDIQPE